MQASPSPAFRMLDEPGTQRIPLDVSHHGIEMIVIRCMNRQRSPARSGRTTKCPWFGSRP
jgi:hypothetical protein